MCHLTKHLVMKNRFYLLVVLMTLSLAACDDEENVIATTCDNLVVIDNDRFQNDASAFFTLIDVSIEGDCMTLEYSSSGCDGNSWVAELVDAEVVRESIPEQRDLRLILENTELCQAVFTQKVSFDITSLQTNESEVALNIEEFEILYSY